MTTYREKIIAELSHANGQSMTLRQVITHSRMGKNKTPYFIQAIKKMLQHGEVQIQVRNPSADTKYLDHEYVLV